MAPVIVCGRVDCAWMLVVQGKAYIWKLSEKPSWMRLAFCRTCGVQGWLGDVSLLPQLLDQCNLGSSGEGEVVKWCEWCWGYRGGLDVWVSAGVLDSCTMLAMGTPWHVSCDGMLSCAENSETVTGKISNPTSRSKHEMGMAVDAGTGDVELLSRLWR